MFLLFYDFIMPGKLLLVITKLTPFFQQFFVLIVFLASSIYITYPLIFHLSDYATSLGDEMLIAWIHSWVIHSFQTNILGLFDANIFYPYLHPLAYSDLFITSSLFAYIPVAFLKEPIVANNVILIFSLFSLGYTTYLLAFYLTKDISSSLIAGLLVIFSPVVLDKYVHIQMLFIFFVPLSLLFLFVYIKTKKVRFLYFWCICFLLQTYNSFLPGYFIVLSSVIIVFYYAFYDRKKLLKLPLRKTAISVMLSLALLIPIIIPYYQVSKTYQFTRDIRETIHLSLQPEDLLYSNQFTRLSPLLTKNLSFLHTPTIELKNGYLGAVFSFLVIIAICFFIVKWKKNRKKIPSMYSLFFVSLTGFILSFGPFLHLGRHTVHYPFPIPLPYAFFYAIAPGFKGFRNVARWEVLFVIGISVCIAYIIMLFGNKYPRIKLYVITLFALLIVAEYNFPMHFVNVPQTKNFPPVYSWLNTRADTSVIVELPIYAWYMHPYATQELMRDYYSTANFLPLVNGASGYSPIPWEENVRQLMIEFPYEPSFSRMKRMGVNYIVFHKDEFTMLNKNKYMIDDKHIESGETLLKQLRTNPHITLVKQFASDYVFALNYD